MSTRKRLNKAAAKGKQAGKLFSQRTIAEIKAEQAEWEASVLEESLKQKTELKGEFRTGSGDKVVNRLYTPADIADISYERNIGFPGQYPFTRGRTPSEFRAHVEPFLYYTGFGSSEDANQRYKTLIAQGGTYIGIAFDLPTQLGYDSDHPLARGEVGKVGVAVDSLEDMERIFDGIPLDKIGISGSTGIGPVLLALFYNLGKKKGVPPHEMRVGIQNDPLRDFAGRGDYMFSVRMHVSLGADVVEFCDRYLPKWVPQYACTAQVRWGGCTAAQELAFGIADFITYVEAALERGVRLDVLMSKTNLHLTVDNDLFEEVAKFRAARRLWAKIASQRFKTEDPRVLGLTITAYTGSHRLTAQQPLNNTVRTTAHVLACMLGGAIEIYAPAYDEALGLPTVESARVGHLTKQILYYETGITNTVDPLGGSYYIESLTNQIEEQAKEYFDKVEAMGGAIGALEKGYYLREMADGMYKYHQEVENGERVVIGVNKYQLDEELPIKLFKGSPEAEKRQIERVKKLREQRDNSLVQASLEKVRKAAQEKAVRSTYNIVPSLIEAVGAYATLGEIYAILREVLGEGKPPKIF